ncbi:hypothetical protein [Mesorhizobium sp. B3-2-1]|uniref:hypothetical protein n=1 Tax=Mesorhizobium sp. B3-2-1 TaxID=2589891 RepID=UPI0015E34D81|nr:hypothetical protein [Mesorhizobium sp. B3-2-1]
MFRSGWALLDSSEALDTFLATSRPSTFVDWDRYHRFVGDCRRADGASVADWMVEQGQAPDWPRYSRGAYPQQQATVEATKVASAIKRPTVRR